MGAGVITEKQAAQIIGEACQNVLGEPVVWGLNDCCMWVADILVEAGLPDPAAEYRGRYKTSWQAFRLLGNPSDFAAQLAKRMGWSMVMPEEAQVLSVGWVPTMDGPSAAISDGRYFVHRVPGGVEFSRPEYLYECWRPKWL